MMLAPPAPFLPPEQFGKPVVGLVLVWVGELAQGEQVIAPLRRIVRPIADVVRPVLYVFVQSMLDGSAPHGRHYYWRSHQLPYLSDDVIDVFVERNHPTGAQSGSAGTSAGWRRAGLSFVDRPRGPVAWRGSRAR